MAVKLSLIVQQSERMEEDISKAEEWLSKIGRTTPDGNTLSISTKVGHVAVSLKDGVDLIDMPTGLARYVFIELINNISTLGPAAISRMNDSLDKMQADGLDRIEQLRNKAQAAKGRRNA